MREADRPRLDQRRTFGGKTFHIFGADILIQFTQRGISLPLQSVLRHHRGRFTVIISSVKRRVDFLEIILRVAHHNVQRIIINVIIHEREKGITLTEGSDFPAHRATIHKTLIVLCDAEEIEVQLLIQRGHIHIRADELTIDVRLGMRTGDGQPADQISLHIVQNLIRHINTIEPPQNAARTGALPPHALQNPDFLILHFFKSGTQRALWMFGAGKRRAFTAGQTGLHFINAVARAFVQIQKRGDIVPHHGIGRCVAGDRLRRVIVVKLHKAAGKIRHPALRLGRPCGRPRRHGSTPARRPHRRRPLLHRFAQTFAGSLRGRHHAFQPLTHAFRIRAGRVQLQIFFIFLTGMFELPHFFTRDA